jgi:hypothetical protein
VKIDPEPGFPNRQFRLHIGVRSDFLMSNSHSRLLDVFDVKKRKLEEMVSSRRRVLEMFSSASLLARIKQEGLIAGKWNDPAAASPHKSAATRGGRKRLPSEKQRFYIIGRAVDEQFHKFDRAFKLLRELKIIDQNWDLDTLRSKLEKRNFTQKEIDAVLQSRTPLVAAKRFVAKCLTSHKHPSGISLQTVSSCYSRYLKALKSKHKLLQQLP